MSVIYIIYINWYDHYDVDTDVYLIGNILMYTENINTSSFSAQ